MEFEKQIMRNCSVPIEQIKVYEPAENPFLYDKPICEITAKLSFNISISIFGETLKRDRKKLAKTIARIIDAKYREKMELAGIYERGYL